MPDFDFPASTSPSYLFSSPHEVCPVEGPWEMEVGPVREVPAADTPSAADLAELKRYEPLIPRHLRFDSDSAAIRPHEQFSLSGFASSLANRALPFRVEIVGHADSTGTDEHNVALSEARAMAVGRYLTGHGVQVNVELEGHGEREPVAPNDTPEGREANRRVEIRLAIPTAR